MYAMIILISLTSIVASIGSCIVKAARPSSDRIGMVVAFWPAGKMRRALAVRISRGSSRGILSVETRYECVEVLPCAVLEN